jgi:DNA-binding XRE family transcriptional regulator
MTKTTIPHARRQTPRSLREYLAGPPAVSQRALADAVGCNQSMVSMLARGRREPSARLAVKLHAVTGVPLKALLARKMPPEAPPRKPPRAAPVRAGPAPRASAHDSP